MPRGLAGVVVAETAVSDVRGDEGFYQYRDRSAIELAASATFEDAWQLLVTGDAGDGCLAWGVRRPRGRCSATTR